MGAFFAEYLANDSGLDREQAVRIHLAHNCFPPADAFTVQALEAIDRVNAGENFATIALPRGILTRDGSEVASAIFLVTSLHLDVFLEGEDDE